MEWAFYQELLTARMDRYVVRDEKRGVCSVRIFGGC